MEKEANILLIEKYFYLKENIWMDKGIEIEIEKSIIMMAN